MTDNDSDFTVAIFPYLKTTSGVRIGLHYFRSTDDLAELSDDQAAAVTEIVRMLFVQDNARVRSASYAIIPRIIVNGAYQIPESMRRVQALIAYIYGRHLPAFERAALLLLTPDRVLRPLVETSDHIIHEAPPPPVEWEEDVASGYSGFLNFDQPLWVAKGSRIYPPVLHIDLIMSQDLAADFRESRLSRDYSDLIRLVSETDLQVAERLFTSLTWYNLANRTGANEDEALVCLAIASSLSSNFHEKTRRSGLWIASLCSLGEYHV